MVACEEMSQRIKSDGGSGLVADYGEDGLTDFTLRVCMCTTVKCTFFIQFIVQSFRDHSEHHVLVEPGSADLTADVDFSLLRRIAEREGIASHGPMTQNAFLHKMGIRQRVDVSGLQHLWLQSFHGFSPLHTAITHMSKVLQPWSNHMNSNGN